jgi:cell wall-associated NlpC family hydrolase
MTVQLSGLGYGSGIYIITGNEGDVRRPEPWQVSATTIKDPTPQADTTALDDTTLPGVPGSTGVTPTSGPTTTPALGDSTGIGTTGDAAIQARIVAVANGYAARGFIEGPGNDNPFSPNGANQAWCQDFVNQVLAEAGVTFPSSARVSGTLAALGAWKKAGAAIAARNAQPGDIVYKTRTGGGHVGVVVAVGRDGTLTTVQGNAGIRKDRIVKETNSVSHWNLGAVRPTAARKS